MRVAEKSQNRKNRVEVQTENGNGAVCENRNGRQKARSKLTGFPRRPKSWWQPEDGSRFEDSGLWFCNVQLSEEVAVSYIARLQTSDIAAGLHQLGFSSLSWRQQQSSHIEQDSVRVGWTRLV